MEKVLELIEKKLISLFKNNEFISYRSFFFGKKIDRNSFISANIVFMLENSNLRSAELRNCLNECKLNFDKYHKNGLYYHWPIINERSNIQNAGLLSKLKAMDLSPDADCSAIINLISNGKEKALIDAIKFYQTEVNSYKKFRYQEEIYSKKSIPLTWFPPPERKNKYEQIDFVVLLHIMLFLLKKMPASPLLNDLTIVIDQILITDHILKKPFNVSPYYPSPFLIILFLYRFLFISQTKNEFWWQRCMELLNSIETQNESERLFLNLITLNTEEAAGFPDTFINMDEFEFPPVYHAPFLAFMNTNSVLITSEKTHMKFYSKAFYLAYIHLILSKKQKGPEGP